MVPGKDINIRVDHVYGRSEALRVIEAARADYETHYGALLRQTD
jgi:inorganic pyrophosphatase